MDDSWDLALIEAEGRQRTRGFANIPFDGVQAVAAICDVGRADILRRGDQIAKAYRNEGS